MQPLSGEYAGRRETLEQVPFFSGYKVELGLLVDIAARFGVDAIAQVDLDRRVHRNQDMQALGRMSFGILQAAFLRLAEEGRSAPERLRHHPGPVLQRAVRVPGPSRARSSPPGARRS